jgi:Rrf2 family protein
MAAPVTIPESVSLAFHAMVLLAADPSDGRLSIAKLRVGKTSLDHLSKVLQRLVRAGLVTSRRGARGGFRLAKPAGEITLLDIWVALEGTAECTPCLLHMNGCPIGSCVFGNLIAESNTAFERYFAGTTLTSFRETQRGEQNGC